jgi:vacuolar fusion protein MON1
MNTIHSPSIFNSPAASSWIPFCLPKFNAGGFVNAYITFIRKDNNVHLSDVTASPAHDDRDSTKSLESTQTKENSQSETQVGLDESGIAFVCISGSGEFDAIRGWCDSVINVIHLLNFWINVTYYYYISEIKFRWNIDCTRECLPE